jgi:cell wall-associated NlpC family hydrolase
VTVPAITGGDGLAAVQSRISELEARFMGGSGAAFGAVLANQLSGLRTASSVGGTVAARLPAGLSPAVDIAQQYLGVPYVWGGASPAGFDCSGLVQYVYRQLGVDLPRTAADQAGVGRPVASLADARPGDLVAFGDPVDHIGIYAGDGLMVVAPKTGDVVKVQSVYTQPTAIRRVLPSAGTGFSGLSFSPGDLAIQRSSLLAALSSFPGAAS